MLVYQFGAPEVGVKEVRDNLPVVFPPVVPSRNAFFEFREMFGVRHSLSVIAQITIERFNSRFVPQITASEAR